LNCAGTKFNRTTVATFRESAAVAFCNSLQFVLTVGAPIFSPCFQDTNPICNVVHFARRSYGRFLAWKARRNPATALRLDDPISSDDKLANRNLHHLSQERGRHSSHSAMQVRSL
jgi:hypothetical protein